MYNNEKIIKALNESRIKKEDLFNGGKESRYRFVGDGNKLDYLLARRLLSEDYENEIELYDNNLNKKSLGKNLSKQEAIDILRKYEPTDNCNTYYNDHTTGGYDSEDYFHFVIYLSDSGVICVRFGASDGKEYNNTIKRYAKKLISGDNKLPGSSNVKKFLSSNDERLSFDEFREYVDEETDGSVDNDTYSKIKKVIGNNPREIAEDNNNILDDGTDVIGFVINESTISEVYYEEGDGMGYTSIKLLTGKLGKFVHTVFGGNYNSLFYR